MLHCFTARMLHEVLRAGGELIGSAAAWQWRSAPVCGDLPRHAAESRAL